MKKHFFLFAAIIFSSLLHAQTPDSVIREPKLGTVLRTVREMEMTGDTAKEILQIETTKAKNFGKIGIRFSIYKEKKLIYTDSWKANAYFDPKDKLPDSIKWKRLRRIITYFFSNQNFSSSADESLHDLLERLKPGDIKLDSHEAEELAALPHTIIAVYAGRDNLYGLTYIGSKKKFLKVWRN